MYEHIRIFRLSVYLPFMVCGLGIFFLSDGLFAGEEEKDDTPRVKQQAQQLTSDREKLGRKLLKQFKNTENTIELRLQCAAGLGILKYEPAIPSLIQFVEMQGKGQLFSESSVLAAYPCVDALREYGAMATTHIIRSLVAEKKKSRCLLLLLAIYSGGTTKDAMVFAKGLLADTKGREQRLRIRDLISAFREGHR